MNEEEIKKKLYEEYPIADELTYDNHTIEYKIKNQLTLELKYWDLLQNEKYQLDKLEDLMIDARYIAYDKLKFENDRTLTKTEIDETYLPREKPVRIIAGKIKDQKVRIDFFKMCYNSVKQLNWNMQNYIKAQGLL